MQKLFQLTNKGLVFHYYAFCISNVHAQLLVFKINKTY